MASLFGLLRLLTSVSTCLLVTTMLLSSNNGRLLCYKWSPCIHKYLCKISGSPSWTTFPRKHSTRTTIPVGTSCPRTLSTGVLLNLSHRCNPLLNTKPSEIMWLNPCASGNCPSYDEDLSGWTALTDGRGRAAPGPPVPLWSFSLFHWTLVNGCETKYDPKKLIEDWCLVLGEH